MAASHDADKAPPGARPDAGPAAGPPPADESPPPGTVERWAYDFVTSTDLAHKLAPPPPPEAWQPPGAPARRLAAPGRPARL
ncbi:MAG TPA: hypothetical protein VFS43_38055, partial [Polyangiaceae bacterium]|nr:hypothetical protein [Polyangiaceae bacterium]